MKRLDHIETLKWFDDFYSKNYKFVHSILSKNKKNLIEIEMPDIWGLVENRVPLITTKAYQVKGYTRFNWEELHMLITTLDFCISENGKVSIVEVNQNAFPGIIEINNKKYLSEHNLERLQEIFSKLIENLLLYKKYKGDDDLLTR